MIRIFGLKKIRDRKKKKVLEVIPVVKKFRKRKLKDY